jgi:glycogen debranching enzyme
VRAPLVNVLNGTTFMVSDPGGNIDATGPDPVGLFAIDTRFLSRWILTINGERLTALSTDDLRYFETRFFLVPGTGTVYVDAKLSVIRQRAVSNGFREKLMIFNHGGDPLDLNIRVEADADFADSFEVKDRLPKKGSHYRRVEEDKLVVGYQREAFHRETAISASMPAQLDENGLTFTVRLDARQDWSAELRVEPFVTLPEGKVSLAALPKLYGGGNGPEAYESLDNWFHQAPQVRCEYEPLSTTYRRSLIDLAALRFPSAALEGGSLPAAGLPWFMAVFGRDSIFTSLQALPFVPQLAASTLHELGLRQGTRIDDFRDEDPGRIIHELRLGEMAAFEERPQSPYYGTADATPLFVVLLDEYERWSGDAQLVRDLEFEARAALAWIDDYADLMGLGYIAYQRRNEDTGLENQCWKDSWDSISYRDGRLPGFPRATCELQGYAYDAKMRGARLARHFWNDSLYADLLERQAAELKERFNQDFWIDSEGYYALALDADGAQVDALASNMGHLLWSGIVDDSKADAVIGHLMSPQLHSGWGVRTLAQRDQRYNPIGYHVGTVWPFDNSIIAWGMRRYGYPREAAILAQGMFEAASFFGGRLPEAFGGYDRNLTKFPVEYPTACNPQAWSSGAPLLLMRTMLGLEPANGHLIVDPYLPSTIGQIELLNIPGPWGHIDAFGRGHHQLQCVPDNAPLSEQLTSAFQTEPGAVTDTPNPRQA